MMTIRKNKSPLQMLGTVLVAALFFFQSAGVVISVPAAVVRDDEAETTVAVGELKPFGVVGSHEDELVRVASMRRLLGPFQLCLSCRCCVSAADPSTCATMPCCFGIDCQLPNKPYGVCAFVPKTCNCAYCAI